MFLNAIKSDFKNLMFFCSVYRFDNLGCAPQRRVCPEFHCFGWSQGLVSVYITHSIPGLSRNDHLQKFSQKFWRMAKYLFV
jgi:hypothetical protein